MINKTLPSQIYRDLVKGRAKRPTDGSKTLGVHKWVMLVMKRRRAGHANALVLHPKPKARRTRKRAIAKARFKTKLHDMSF